MISIASTVAVTVSVPTAVREPNPDGEGHVPWALQVLELEAGRIVGFTFFLDTEAVFPLFGLPLQFDA